MDLASIGAWQPLLGETLALSALRDLSERVAAAEKMGAVFPPKEQRFAAFALTPPEQLRCVILGQDPYHEPGQANGLAFSVSEGTALPPSLRNIFKELQSDLGLPPRSNGDLTQWAQQGVLLLNTVLTVSAGKANSHKDFGWQSFTDGVIAAISKLPQPIVFLLWGSQAQKKRMLCRSEHPRLILCAPHPSPLSSYRGFFGRKPFSQVNAFLQQHGEKEIEW